jgi:beta-phosphoglucomutase
LAAAATQGLSFSEKYYFDVLLGFDDVGLFDELFRKNGQRLSQAVRADLIRKKNAAFLAAVEGNVAYFDGVVDLIGRLRAAGIPCAVVSGALRSEITACLKPGGLAHAFECIVSAEDVTRSKPDPEGYERAFVLIRSGHPQIEKSACVALEDSPAGIAAAQAAGIPTIAIVNSVPAEQLAAADRIVHAYREIII